MPNGPKPFIEQTLKTYYKGQMILKMPLSSGGGHFYFTKTDKLQVQFFRIVSSEDKINNPFNGYYEFIDMITYKYKKMKFKEGIRQASINTNTSTINSIQNTSTIKSTETWLGAFFRCLVTHIIAIPRRDIYGEWQCYGFGGGSSDPSEVDEVNNDLQDGGGGFDWASLFLFLNPPNIYTPNPIPDPTIFWDPYLGGGGSYPSNPPLENPPYTDDPNNLNFTIDELDNMFGNPEGQDGEIIDNPNLIEYETPVFQRPLPKLSEWLIYFPKISNTQKMESAQVYELVGGTLKNSYNLERRKYENACAVRGSRGLNYSDPSKPIPVLKYGNPPLQITQKGADQKNYILNAVAFEKYMIDAYGDTPIRLEGAAANNFGEVYKLLKGKSGIYLIINNDASERTGAGYSGHVDAIIDGKCVDNSFVNPKGGVKSIRIWVLRD